MRKGLDRLLHLGRIAWLYTKYQLITKGLLALIVLPITAFLFQIILKSSGRHSISSGDFVQLLFSVQGIGFLILTVGLLALFIAIDVNAFIIISAMIREGKVKLHLRQIIIQGIISLKYFFKPTGILIMIYIAVVIPLVGIGFTIAPMENFHIPNFITDVIFKNPLYLSLYYALMIILVFITLKYIFLFHHIILLEQNIADALKNSGSLIRRHWKSFLRDYIWFGIKWTMVVMTVSIAFVSLPNILTEAMNLSIAEKRFWGTLTLIITSELFGIGTLMVVPAVCYRITDLFYRYYEADGKIIQNNLNLENDLSKNTKTILNTITAHSPELSQNPAIKKFQMHKKFMVFFLVICVMIINIFIASITSQYFDEIFRDHQKIDIIAHRGGGNLGAENTLAGLEAVIREGVDYSEIDVQRTKDGRYIINHDSSFKRVTGVERTSSEMTYEEIQNLKVKDLFDNTRKPENVATIEEFLDAAKDRIGLYIELKGSTADTQMVDDIVLLIKKRQMVEQTAILALDYKLISYVEEKYPEITTGYLYFFSIGKIAQMNVDILIMEEREATAEQIEKIHQAGKKVVVWTVNTKESIDRFVNSDVDGIITDYVLEVKDGIVRRDNRSDFEILIDSFLD